MLIPVPGPQGGVIIVGESVIAYVRKKRSADDQAVKSIQVKATIVKVSPARALVDNQQMYQAQCIGITSCTTLC